MPHYLRFPIVASFSAVVLAAFAFTDSAAADDSITFNKHVAPILFQKCAECHHPGEVAPFSLLTYKDAVKRAGFIKEVTKTRRMPVWKPQPGFGQFKDDRTLTDTEILTLEKWADTGTKEGDPRDLPPEPKFDQEWKLGKPDLLLKMPEPVTIPADGQDFFRTFVLPTDFSEDVFVAGIEIHPGNRRVVHHVNIPVDSTGQSRKLSGGKLDSGLPLSAFTTDGGLGGWVPGLAPRLLPEDYARILKKGSDILLQMHYHPSGKEEKDQSSLGIFLAKKPVKNYIVPLRLGTTRKLAIPAGEKAYHSSTSYKLPVDVQVLTIAPHMHLLGREMKATAILPKGKKVPMIWVNDWDFNWQGPYEYVTPVSLEKGTTLEMEAIFDNSVDNPKNPFNPPRFVPGGSTTVAEMCQCLFVVVTDDSNDRLTLVRDFGMYVRGERASMPKSPRPKMWP